MLPTLCGNRVSLRNLNEQDVCDLFDIYGCQQTMQFASDDTFPSKDTVLQMLASVEQLQTEKRAYEWGVICIESGKLIGTCGLHSFSLAGTSCEVGCVLNREFWGQGIMFEALQLLLSCAVTMGINRVLADIDSDNTRSIALFKKMGFTRSGQQQYELLLSPVEGRT